MTFHKYPKIKRLGDKDTTNLFNDPNDIIYMEEKIDGAQFRFMISNDKIIFGSHNQQIGDSTKDIDSFLQKSNWSNCVTYILSILKDKDLSKYNGYIFYGECCIPHSIQYMWDTMLPFIAYDIMKDDTFFSYDEKIKIFNDLEFNIVKLIDIKQVSEICTKEFTDNDVPKSNYGNVQAEGIVFKNYKTQTFLKFVCQKFKEVNKIKFGESKKYCENDNERLISTYCTNARIDKHIFKLIDDGNQLEMKLMQYLPTIVWTDIVEECSTDILNENWVLDLRQCRKGVAKRCVAVLEQMISLQYCNNIRSINNECT